MAIRTKEDILSSMRERFGEDTSDETLTFIEDVSDTFTDLESKAKGDGKDWKAEAKRIEEEWRKKYKERFFSGKPTDDSDDDFEEEETKQYRFEDLFKKE